MQVVVFLVLLVKHGGRDVRDVAASIALTGHVNLEVLNSERLLEVLEELDKVLRRLFLGGGSRLADGVTSPDGLIDPR